MNVCKQVMFISMVLMFGAISYVPGALAVTFTSSGQVLAINPAARPAGMGEAYTAVGGDINSLYFNPAGLASVINTEVAASETHWLHNMVQQAYGIAYNLHDVRTSNLSDLGTIAAGYTELDLHSSNIRDIAGTITTGPKDKVLAVAYAKKLGGIGTAGSFAFGGGAKFMEEEVDNNKIKNTLFDAGIMWDSPWPQLSAGVAILNAGKKLSYNGIEYQQPQLYSAGISWRPLQERLLVVSDVIFPENGTSRFGGGAEYMVFNAIALRAGYNSGIEEGTGMTAGAGILLKDLDIFFLYAREARIDYAFISHGNLGDMHRVFLTLKLGAE